MFPWILKEDKTRSWRFGRTHVRKTAYQEVHPMFFFR